MAIVYTKDAVDVYAPTDSSGNARGANMGEAQTWGIEAQQAIDNLRSDFDTLVREKLTADRTIYVDGVNGNPSNSGLDSGHALRTLQHAADLVKTYDLNGYNVTISVADATYTTGVIVEGPFVGAVNEYSVLFTGNAGTPGNTLVSDSAGVGFQASNGAKFKVANFEVRCKYDFYAEFGGAKIVTDNVVANGVAVGSSVYFYARRGGYIQLSGDGSRNPGGTFIKSQGNTATPDAIFQTTHGGTIWFESGNCNFLEAVTPVVAAIYILDADSEMTVTGTANFVGTVPTGLEALINKGTMQWAPPNGATIIMGGPTANYHELNGGRFIYV